MRLSPEWQVNPVQTDRKLIYVDKLRWEELHRNLSDLLPNYGPGEIEGVMASHGYSTDWRKVEKQAALLAEKEKESEKSLGYSTRRR